MKLMIAFFFALLGVAFGVDMTQLQPYSLYAHAMFLSEDINADGNITLAELHQIFDRYDANGDGKETRHEYTSFICAVNPDLYQVAHYLYDDWDMNNDHTLEQIDYDNLFNKMDTNKNQLVNDDEFINYFVTLFHFIETQEAHHHGNSHEHGAASCHV